MQSWGSADSCTVSIICAAYNHELYIKDALEGILSQETSFPFEIIIHDDASSDNTANIIREYHAVYPRIVRPIYQKENQYSRNVLNPLINTFAISTGKYIAFCEGDDYWISSNKLQMQTDAMEDNSNVDFSFHSAYYLRNGEIDKQPSWDYGEQKILYADSILTAVGQFAPTASYMFRRGVIEGLPDWFYKAAPIGDFFLEMYGAGRGGVLYIDKPMSVYREKAVESWSSRMIYSSVAHLHHNEKLLESLYLLENDFYGLPEAFGKKRSDPLFLIAIYYLSCGKYSIFRQYISDSADQYRFFSKKQKLAYNLRHLPWVLRLIYKYKMLLPRWLLQRINRGSDGMLV